MKKKLFLLIFCLFLFIPGVVRAYGIKDFYINATVMSDGDLVVEEYFDVNGSYNGYERIILFANSSANKFYPELEAYGGSELHNGDGVEFLEVRAVPKNHEFDFTNVGGVLFNRVSSASKGDYGVYTNSSVYNGKSVLIYNPSNYDNAFYVKYRISNIAIKHNDVGELGWNIPINELADDIENLKVTVKFPGNTNLRVWAHGPLHGEVSKIGEDTLFAEIYDPGEKASIDVRATFDLAVIEDSSKTSGVEALEKILAYEEDAAMQANYERMVHQKQTIEQLDELLVSLNENPTREDYNEANNLLYYIYEEELLNYYQEQLAAIKPKLDEQELNTVLALLDVVKEEKTYSSYMQAEEVYMVIDNTKNKSYLAPLMDNAINYVKEGEKAREIKNYITAIVILIIVLLLEVDSFKRFMASPKSTFKHEYFRDIPSDKSPEVVSYLFHKDIINNALSASILNLINKKVIEIEPSSKNNYKLTDNSSSHEDVLTQGDKDLLKIIFHGESTIMTKDMDSYARKHYSKFLTNWESYNKTWLKIGVKEEYFESDVNNSGENVTVNNKGSFVKKFIYIIIFMVFIQNIFTLLSAGFDGILLIALLPEFIFFVIIALIFFGSGFKTEKTKKSKLTILYILLYLGVEIYSIYKLVSILITQHFYVSSIYAFLVVGIVTFIGFFLLHNSRKRTQKGADEYAIWKALHNFLKDFGRFPDKKSIEVKTWEKYLVYATLFGCADKVLKEMKLENLGIPEEYYNSISNAYYVNNIISHSVHTSHVSATSARNAAYSRSSSGGGSFSSGSGGGGGFSSGGGSFGGGGGGGRF